jgi:ornithine carbamoyltransferase
VRGRNLLSISDLSAQDIDLVLTTAMGLKDRGPKPQLAGRTLALVFEKPSLRTRVSFHVAMKHLGGDCIYLSPPEVGLGERETPEDVARVLSRYVDCIAARTFEQQTIARIAEYADVPVINALSDEEHPCQALADLLTIREKLGRLSGVRVAFIGDGNNVANSLALAAGRMGMHLRVASPAGYEVPAGVLKSAAEAAAQSGGSVEQTDDPQDAAREADVVYTDVWSSMGQEREAGVRREDFAGFTVDSVLLSRAKSDAIFMHDLPAHRGEEVTDEVMESKQSVVFDQAENRLHAQKALLSLVLAQDE